MNGKWTDKWKKLLLWFSAYSSLAAFAIFGGYTIVKDEGEELKKTAKQAFAVTLIFAAASALLSVFYNFASMSNSYYLSAASDFYDISTRLLSAIKIAVYAVIIILELVKKENDTPKVEEKAE